MENGEVIDGGIVAQSHKAIQNVLAILKDRMAAPDVARGVILDGFPRTDGQAAALDASRICDDRAAT